MEGVEESFGFEKSITPATDIKTASLIMRNIRKYINSDLKCYGKRATHQTDVAQGMASAFYSHDLNVTSASRFTGLSPKLLTSGGNLKVHNSKKPNIEFSPHIPTKKVNRYPYLKIWDWLHNACELIEINKQAQKKL